MEASLTTKSRGYVEFGDTLRIEGDQLGDIFESNSINKISFTVEPIIPITHKLSILMKARLNISTIRNNTLNLNEYDFVGGFVPGLVNSSEYYGVGQKEFGLANYFYGKAGLQYELFHQVFLQAQFNYLDTEHPITFLYPNADTGEAGDRKRRFGYGGLIGVRSPVGPIAFAFAKDHYRKGWKTSLIIGFYY
jgi:hypothetical protein